MGEIDGDKSLNLLTAGSGGAGTKEGPLGQLIRVKAKSLVVCPCGSSTERDATFSVLDLIYPKKVCPPSRPRARLTQRQSAPDLSPNTNFFKIVESSLIRNTTTSRILCKSCQQNVWMQSRRTFGTSAGGGTDEGCACELPPILVINAGVGTRDELDFWQGVAGTKGKTTIGAGEPKRFLEDHFTVRRNGQGLSVTDAVVEGGVHYRLRVRLAGSGSTLLTSVCSRWSCRCLTRRRRRISSHSRVRSRRRARPARAGTSSTTFSCDPSGQKRPSRSVAAGRRVHARCCAVLIRRRSRRCSSTSGRTCRRCSIFRDCPSRRAMRSSARTLPSRGTGTVDS